MIKGITIIVCTYNGEERLRPTLQSISKQQLPQEIKWEVIIADNASSDHSSEVALAEWNNYNLHIPFNIISESKPGKLYALQHAINKARYEYLIICDDDNWLALDYAAKAYHILDSMPEVGAAGGLGIPVTDGTPLPEWFKDYNFAYAVGPQAKKTGLINPRAILWGAGMVTRKSLYLSMYKTYQSFLPEHNTNILSAEDSEYCMRLILKGYRLYYDESLIYHHFIPNFRLTTTFRDNKLLKGFKDSNIILRKYYAAMRANLKTKGRLDIWLGLVLVSPLNYLFGFSAKRREKAKNTLFHLLPFGVKSDSISMRIKAFIKEK